jgi:FixJ family two-component response regulator
MIDSAEPLVSVVDDDASLRRSVQNLLASVGFRVETFASAEDFLGSSHREQTRCLVLDLRMPGMTGFELLARLAALGSLIPVIVLTAHNDDEARRRTVQAGAVAFLGKPFRGDHLLDAVRAALGRGDPRR